MKSMFSALRVWADMVKLPHSIFALPFAMMATFLAGRSIPGRRYPFAGQLLLVIMCMVAARSVAMTFNRIVDAAIDARNPRTASRPLPAGRLSLAAAIFMLVLSIASFGIGCVGFAFIYDNTWPILLSAPVLLYLCGYSYAKRFTRWSHFYLGSAIAISPVAAWIAVNPTSIGLPAILLAIALTCWIGGFDIIYACQDIEVDRREGLHSLPSRLGPRGALWIARCVHVVSIVALIVLGLVAPLGRGYTVGLCIAALLLIVENSIVHPGDYRRVNMAFFTINGTVSLVLAAGTLIDIVMMPYSKIQGSISS
ncbi:MAG: UbiA family prenyltransferase [Planctomycetes bacterium]|nr:UbiA family prenyltransferase [Planctomycetota bacterium]